jgi:hypothetical protein
MFGCGGAAPPPASPATPAPVQTSPPEPTAPPAEPEKPKQVSIASIEIEGGGTTEADVRSAFGALADEYESCYSSALAAEPDAAGRMLVTLLYVKGERKSVSASYQGRGSAELNPCFTRATGKLELSPDPAAERVVIVARFTMAKAE